MPPPLHFLDIHIRRMPGFPHGGITLHELARGVNVIHGPNGSGKTTLGRAICTLLAPKGQKDLDRGLAAVLDMDGHRAEVDYQAGRVQFWLDKQPTDMPDLGLATPQEVERHHVLALHDLIRFDSGSDLAAEIVRQAAGGYDIAAARKELGFADGPVNRRGLAKALGEATAACRDARAKQQALVRQENELGELKQRRRSAREAGLEATWIAKAEQYHKTRRQCEQDRLAVAAFPEGIAKLVGDERRRLTLLQQQLADSRSQRLEEETRLEEARRALSRSRLAEDFPEEQIVALRRRCEDLIGLRGRIDQQERELLEATKRIDAAQTLGGSSLSNEGRGAQRAIPHPPNPSPTETITLDLVHQLGAFARRFEQARAEVEAALAMRRWTGTDTTESEASPAQDEDVDLLREGAKTLESWRAIEPPPHPYQHRRPAIALTVVTLIGAGLLAWLVHPSWLLMIVVGVGLLVWALTPSRPLDRREPLVREFEALGLPTPASWNSRDVGRSIRELRRRADDAAMARRMAEHWDTRTQACEKAERRAEGMRNELAAWRQRLALSSDGDEVEPTWLHLWAVTFLQRHEQETRRRTIETRLAADRREHNAFLGRINQPLEQLGLTAATDLASASAGVDELGSRSQLFRKATEQIERGQKTLEDNSRQQELLHRDIATLFARPGLTTDDEATLVQWVGKHPDYLDAAEQLRIAEHQFADAQGELASRPDLLDVDPRELIDRHETLRQQADTLEAISQQIGAIESAVESAKQTATLEDALANEQARCERLVDARTQDEAAVAGGVLTDFLAQDQRQHRRPQVFRLAADLFAQITNGSFTLDITPGDPPAFQAVDTSLQQAVNLDNLSSGTRLQLLLAVRLAFVETHEREHKLPLILDETLGNSDELRAQAIIEAAVQISRRGRQIFYLTAQHDEATKWKTHLEAVPSLPCKLIDLAEVRNLGQAERYRPVDFTPIIPPDIPSPDALDWTTYGERLEVEPIDPLATMGAVHLWYVLDDPAKLFDLLKMGISRWGQFQGLRQHDRTGVLAIDDDAMQRAEASARLIKRVLTLRGIGHGKPVGRAVLIASGAVTDKFLETVDTVAEQLGRDAERLLIALRNKQVKGFLGRKIDELAAYLTEHEYLDSRPPLTPDEIREQARASMLTDLQTNNLSLARFDWLVTRIAAYSPAAQY